MKRLFTAVAALLWCAALSAQTPQPLYPNGAPEDNGLNKENVRLTDSRLDGAVDADYFLFLPDKGQATGQAVIICPGGGYSGVGYAHEGIDVAKWLNEQGIAGIVLRYRMPNGHHEIPLKDVHETFRMVRRNAAQWNINPDKIGIIGFSAGGHLAATAAVYYDAQTRPAFAILIYPVITFYEKYANTGSRYNLIGRNYNAALVDRYSVELHVQPDTPPVFMAFSDDDKVVVPRNGTMFYDALKEKDIPAEFHIYPSGGHGWGWNPNFKYVNEFRTALARWLREINN